MIQCYSHNDLPYTIRNYYKDDLSQVDLTQDLTQVEPWASDPSSHTDIPRMKEGRLGAQFWSAYISCNAQYQDAVQLFLEQVDVIKRMAADYPDDMVYAETADEVEQALAEGRTASLIGVESGHAINSNLAMLRVFHEMGMRYMTLTHSCNTPWFANCFKI